MPLAAVATAAAAGIGSALRGALDVADETGKTAASLGVTTEALSRLRFAAYLSGLSVSSLDTALRQLSRSMAGAAANGGGQMGRTFRDLGVEVTDLDGNLRDAEAVLHDLADAFAGMPNSAQKSASAMAIFGRSGAQMIPLLNEGADGLRRLGDEAQAMGLVISERTARDSARFNDALTRLGAVARGLSQQLAADLAPAAAAVAERMAAAHGPTGNFAKHLREVNRDARLATDAIRGFLQEIGALGRSRTEALQRQIRQAEQDVLRLREAIENTPEGLDAAYGAVQDAFGAPAPFSNLQDDLRKAEAALADLQIAAVAYANAGNRAARSTGALAAEVSGLDDEIDDLGAGAGGGGGGAAPIRAIGEASIVSQDQLRGLVREAERLRENELRRVAEAGERMGRTLGDAFADAATGARSLRDALADVLNDLGRNLISAGISSATSNLFGTLFGNIKIPGFAAGTRFATGGLAWVGERGPELVNLPRGSQVIPNDEIGPGGSYVFAPNIDARGADAAAVARIEANQREMFKEFRSSFADRTARAVAKPWRRGTV